MAVLRKEPCPLHCHLSLIASLPRVRNPLLEDLCKGEKQSALLAKHVLHGVCE